MCGVCVAGRSGASESPLCVVRGRASPHKKTKGRFHEHDRIPHAAARRDTTVLLWQAGMRHWMQLAVASLLACGSNGLVVRGAHAIRPAGAAARSPPAFSMLAAAKQRLAVVYPIREVAELTKELESAASDDELMILMATQPRCMNCKALYPKFDAFARARPDLRLFQVNALPADGRKVCNELSVTALPTIVIFERGEAVWKSTMTVPQWKDFLDEVDSRASDA